MTSPRMKVSISSKKCRFDSNHGKSGSSFADDAENTVRDNTSVYFVELPRISKVDEEVARSRDPQNLLGNVLLHKNAVTIATVVVSKIADRQITVLTVERLSAEILVFDHQRDIRRVKPTFNCTK